MHPLGHAYNVRQLQSSVICFKEVRHKAGDVDLMEGAGRWERELTELQEGRWLEKSLKKDVKVSFHSVWRG